mmetsp:Transcript_8516/g.17513  ORF Transcript_8516/g.17513 Transcript_8516/m.17513 type:complete len:227 (-) Transcript_8516:698-1378(-)
MRQGPQCGRRAARPPVPRAYGASHVWVWVPRVPSSWVRRCRPLGVPPRRPPPRPRLPLSPGLPPGPRLPPRRRSPPRVLSRPRSPPRPCSPSCLPPPPRFFPRPRLLPRHRVPPGPRFPPRLTTTVSLFESRGRCPSPNPTSPCTRPRFLPQHHFLPQPRSFPQPRPPHLPSPPHSPCLHDGWHQCIRPIAALMRGRRGILKGVVEKYAAPAEGGEEGAISLLIAS